ncbi:MAG: hypothetical protein K2N28_09365 [Muribaculaceae bacterium]|nr:hypothetical protein [Muribaculaceae bacterium]
MKQIIRIAIVIAGLFTTLIASAKDYSITLSSNVDGAMVYLNGKLISHTTPAIVSISDKVAKNTMMFQFVKEGYETRTITVSYNKKELKNKPVVYCQLKEDMSKPIANDPTVTKNMANQRVSKEKAGQTEMERTIIRWFFDSDPRGARIFYRVISSVPTEVKNTNETYLTTTPLEETRGFNIQGLTYENSRDVTIEIKATKKGYEDQVKRFNVRQALDQQEISGFFELVKKEVPNVVNEE